MLALLTCHLLAFCLSLAFACHLAAAGLGFEAGRRGLVSSVSMASTTLIGLEAADGLRDLAGQVAVAGRPHLVFTLVDALRTVGFVWRDLDDAGRPHLTEVFHSSAFVDDLRVFDLTAGLDTARVFLGFDVVCFASSLGFHVLRVGDQVVEALLIFLVDEVFFSSFLVVDFLRVVVAHFTEAHLGSLFLRDVDAHLTVAFLSGFVDFLAGEATLADVAALRVVELRRTGAAFQLVDRRVVLGVANFLMLACLDGRVVFFADVVFLTEPGFLVVDAHLGVALAGTHFGVALATLRFGVAFAAVRFGVALAALHLGVAARLGVAFTAFHLGEALPESLLLLGSVQVYFLTGAALASSSAGISSSSISPTTATEGSSAAEGSASGSGSGTTATGDLRGDRFGVDFLGVFFGVAFFGVFLVVDFSLGCAREVVLRGVFLGVHLGVRLGVFLAERLALFLPLGASCFDSSLSLADSDLFMSSLSIGTGSG